MGVGAYVCKLKHKEVVERRITERHLMHIFFFLLALQPQFGPWPMSIKLSVSLWFYRS
jgi:hypothetical protein